MSWWSFKPYISAAQKKTNALKEIAKLTEKGQVISPVKLEGKKIAATFWGKAWCNNLEAYSDLAYRLPRGRSYLRNGSVVDLQIGPGNVTALVSGSSLYRVSINIRPLVGTIWSDIQQNCAGQIASVIELLKGGISDHVMEIVTRKSNGLFPSPDEIEMSCSCPDWAGMCKHVAAALYGVGARLDQTPEMLFALRQVDHLDLIAQAGDVTALTRETSAAKVIAAGDLADVFGIELAPAFQSPSVKDRPLTAKPKRLKPHARQSSKPSTVKKLSKQIPPKHDGKPKVSQARHRTKAKAKAMARPVGKRSKAARKPS